LLLLAFIFFKSMIAIVFPQFYGVHGIARYIDSYLANLPDVSNRVLLITGDDEFSPRSYRGVEIINLPMKPGRFSLLQWSWAARKLLISLYKEKRISCVNFHFPPLIPGLFLPSDVPMVLTAHTTYLGMSGRFYPEKYFNSPWGRVSLFIKQWMERVAFRHARAVITLTEQGRQEVAKYNYAGPVHIIPNGVDLSRFTPALMPVRDIDVLFVGRIEIRKGSRPLVDVCRSLIKRNPKVKIAIVGYGDDDVYVNDQLSSLGENILLAGKVSFELVSGYYNRSKVYASTSYYEGLPGTCLEAMAMGLPVVVWDLLFYRGLVDNGRNGVVVSVNDVERMAGAILDVCSDPVNASMLGAAGRAHLAENYDWRNLSRSVTEVISSYSGE
jgi:glycosyltransferase involved in cell wall biosynthesis